MKDSNHLNDKIYSVLKNEIKEKKICLLDLPNYYNPGDQLIWEGNEQIFEKLGVKIKYRSSLHFFNPLKVSKSDCIVLQGGGNFGDLYSKHQKFREYIISTYPDNKIIILPVTIHFSNKINLTKSAKLFSKHKNLVICVRDNNSYKIVEDNFMSSKNYLLPDTAFAIENIEKNIIKKPSNKVLFLRRTDKEKGKNSSKNTINLIKYLDVSDWPTYDQREIKLSSHLFFLYLNRLILKCWKIFGLHWSEKNDVYGIIKFHSKERQINSAVEFLNQYDLVISTRLHGHILACLLGIPNIMLNNSYGKNKNFYETWMMNNTLNTYFADSEKSVKRIIKDKFPELVK